MRQIGALYLHIPFCVRKCAYCDFESAPTRRGDPRMEAYARDLCERVARLAEAGLIGGVSTAYLGGGTPTMLGARTLGRLARAVTDACPSLVELTCEANPESLTDEVLGELRAAGVTRLSIGVQSLSDDELLALGRVHTAAQAAGRMSAAVATGLDVSVDLMCATPHQTRASWEQTLVQAVGLGVGHVSVYPLTIEEGTPFDALYADEPVPWNDEEVQAQRMVQAQEVLEAAGLARYEVASYARPGKECRHNCAYWTGVPYLGLGTGAASMLDGGLYEQVAAELCELPALSRAAARVRFSLPDPEPELLSEREAWAEDLMLGMRMTRGVEASRVPAATSDELMARGLVEARAGRLVPTRRGWLLGNELYGALWDLATAT